MTPKEILASAGSVLVIDWPDKEVPVRLALAGLRVVVRGGPGPTDHSAYETQNGEVVVRHIGRPPERADLIYSYRPLSELPQIIETTKMLGARTIWMQSGMSAAGVKDPKGCWLTEEERDTARSLVQMAGLVYLSEPYIVDVAGEMA